jgi:CRISPR-associated protein Cmr3
MQGVVRSAILLTHCKDLNLFGSGKCDTCGEKKCPLPPAIGSPKDGEYGNLDIFGPYLFKQGNRYFPAPLDLMKEKEEAKRLFSLIPSIPSKAVSCDLGNIRLPAKPENSNFKPFDAAVGWMREDALLRYLKDKKMPAKGELLDQDKPEERLYEKEPRVGIAREYKTHKAEEGKLYSVVPLRFQKDVGIGLRVGGVNKDLEPEGFATKIGGEGRVCGLEIPEKEYSTSYGMLNLKDSKKIKLVLLQPADFDGMWRPASLQKHQQGDGSTCWEGAIDSINGLTLSLISACIGRQQKIGGWDVVKKAVKPMKSYVPAGSVYFFEVKDLGASEIPVEGKIGNNTKIGLGHYLLGRW